MCARFWGAGFERPSPRGHAECDVALHAKMHLTSGLSAAGVGRSEMFTHNKGLELRKLSLDL
ncbi:hypothetical protein CEB3_c14340 [Peptococcaceae bacterium CEB3]|nr:hypothetical protein CEB3_c14340 [Peptococcaceae bacterium CEB3]